MALPKLTLVLGGARSGKSALAEKLVLDTGKRPVYLASAQAFDDEMRARIADHQAMRAGHGWETVEAPVEVTQPIAALAADQAMLFDCATLWLSNVMLAERNVEAECARLLDALDNCRGRVVVVSNEVGLGVVPDNALARRFRDAQGVLNQRIAERAGLVVAVMAGLPMVLKGQMP